MKAKGMVAGVLGMLALVVALGSAACGKDDPVTPSPTLRANPGGPYQTQHNLDITMSGLSSTSSPNAIAEYLWNCGQMVGSTCLCGTTVGNVCQQTGPTPIFRYRRCGAANRPACRTGSSTVADYTVSLTIRDTAGNTNTATTTVTVTNNY
ncbi:MAG: hypothetical protein AB7O32_05125 [Vicinamibacterales bacterium]